MQFPMQSFVMVHLFVFCCVQAYLNARLYKFEHIVFQEQTAERV